MKLFHLLVRSHSQHSTFTVLMLLPVKHTDIITQVNLEVNYQDFKVCNLKDVTVWEASFGTCWSGYLFVKERCHCTGKVLGTESSQSRYGIDTRSSGR